MTQIHNIIKNEQNSNIKYALKDLEENENDTMKMYMKISNAATENLSDSKCDALQHQSPCPP